MPTHFGAQRLLSADKKWMYERVFIALIGDTFEMPHVQLSCKRPVLGLTKEKRQELD